MRHSMMICVVGVEANKDKVQQLYKMIDFIYN
jgi:hypothetical protein